MKNKSDMLYVLDIDYLKYLFEELNQEYDLEKIACIIGKEYKHTSKKYVNEGLKSEKKILEAAQKLADYLNKLKTRNIIENIKASDLYKVKVTKNKIVNYNLAVTVLTNVPGMTFSMPDIIQPRTKLRGETFWR